LFHFLNFLPSFFARSVFLVFKAFMAVFLPAFMDLEERDALPWWGGRPRGERGWRAVEKAMVLRCEME